jgi:hypothetical protein
MRLPVPVTASAVLLLAMIACRTGALIVLDSGSTPGAAPASAVAEPSPTFSREEALRLALQAAKASQPEVGMLEARTEAVTAELIDRTEAEKRAGSSGLDSSVGRVWYVEVRGYFRYSGMPAPGQSARIYEAERRAFVYAALSGRLLASLFPDAHPAAAPASPTASPATPPLPRVAFVRGGDIYVLDPAAGSQFRLTEDGRNRSPIWTSDGRSLLFTKEPAGWSSQENWRWQQGTSTERLGQGVPPPTGDAIASEEPTPGADGTSAVWIERGGARWQVMPSVPGMRMQPLAWTADGRQLSLSRLPAAPMRALPDVQKSLQVLPSASLRLADAMTPKGAVRELRMPPTFQGIAGVADVAWFHPTHAFWLSA